MRTMLVIHILGGAIGLLSGYIALYSAKGDRLHRKSGMVFVVAMLTMAIFGAAITNIKSNTFTIVNTSAALLTVYLVTTALTAVRAQTPRWSQIAGTVLVSTVAIVDLTCAIQAIANGGRRNGVPLFPFVMFGVVALLAAIGDLRILRSGALRGARRIARHLWRMSFALFIAALSFFLGQAKVIPKPIRIPGLLALPVLAVLFTMLYWLWRVQRKPKATENVVTLKRAA